MHKITIYINVSFQIIKYPKQIKLQEKKKPPTLKQLEDINRHNGSILKRTRDLWSHFFPNSSWNRKLDKFADQTRLSNGVPKSRQVSDLCRVNDRTPVGQLFNQLFTRVRAVNRFYQQLLHPWCDSQLQTSRGVTGRGGRAERRGWRRRRRGPARLFPPRIDSSRGYSLHACYTQPCYRPTGPPGYLYGPF